MNYEIWPGIGLSESPVEWAKVLGTGTLSTKSTANVDRRRSEGSDFSTFRGMSKRSDALSARGAPKTVRRVKVAVGVRGPAPGHALNPESRMGQMRAALADGPKTRAELCKAVGIEPKNITGYLKNDIRQGRIVKIEEEGCFQRFALAEVE